MIGRQTLRAIGDTRAVAAIEFAMIAPVLFMFMMGMGDLLYQVITTAVVNGSVQKAARDATIEGNATTTAGSTLDTQVIAMVRVIAPNATFVATRQSYSNFTNVGKPEPFTDSNGDGIRQVGECFSDINGNGTWDSDDASLGAGGASEVALYTMKVTYPRIFSIQKFMGWADTATVTAQTVLKNQPYANQTVRTAATLCT